MKYFIILIMLFSVGHIFALQPRDVIYLKNGSVVKGTIKEMNPTSDLKIETSDGNLFVFKMAEIERMTKETVPDSEKLATDQKFLSIKKSAVQENTTLGRISLGFQPAGFLQFGPVIDMGFRVGNNFVIGPHFRYTSLGLAFNLMEEFENTMLCFGGGFTVKHFPISGQKNKFYYGIGLEYEYSDYDDEGDWYGTAIGIITMINTGYRFRFNSGFYMNIGIFAGAYNNISNVWYDYYNDAEHDVSGYTEFYGYLEFAIGVEF